MSLANKATAAGGGVAFFAGMSAHDVIAWCGLAVAVAGFLANIWFKWDARRRAQKLYDARMANIERRRRSDTDMAPLTEDE